MLLLFIRWIANHVMFFLYLKFSGFRNRWKLAASIMNTWCRHILLKQTILSGFPFLRRAQRKSPSRSLMLFSGSLLSARDKRKRFVFPPWKWLWNHICFAGLQLQLNFKIYFFSSCTVGVCSFCQFIKSDQACSPNRRDTSLIWSCSLRISGN